MKFCDSYQTITIVLFLACASVSSGIARTLCTRLCARREPLCARRFGIECVCVHGGNPARSAIAHAYLGRASAYLATRQFENAIGDYTQAIRLDPTLGNAYKPRGDAYLRTGDREMAEVDFDRAKKLGLTARQNSAFACWR